MKPFQSILTDFIRETAQIMEEFQVQCQEISFELPNLDLTKQLPLFRYCPSDKISENQLREASNEEIEQMVIETAKHSPKGLLNSSHFTTKVKNLLISGGLNTTKAKIKKAVDKLNADGKVSIEENL